MAPKPETLSHAEAASLPLAAGTAWDAVVTRAGVMIGETLLIHGVGGVGSAALQIAKAAGARVLATCSDYIPDLAEELGADRTINYKAEDFGEIVNQETGGRGVDVVIDTVGGGLLTKSIPVTRDFGLMVSVVSTDTGMGVANRKNITVHHMFLMRARYKLEALNKLIARGQLRPVIDSTLPLTDVAEAHRRLAQGGVRGKIVLEVS